MTDTNRPQSGASADDSPVHDYGYVTAMLDALRDPVRRQVVDILQFHGETLALADLAEEVAERQYQTSITHISANDVRSVYLTLYHRHIPKLSSAGLVAYYQEMDLVRLVDIDSATSAF